MKMIMVILMISLAVVATMLPIEIGALIILFATLTLSSSLPALEVTSMIGDSIFIDQTAFAMLILTLLIFSFMPMVTVCMNFLLPGFKFKMLMILMMILLLIFTTAKLISFYMLFELSLIPIFMIIMGWGYQIERLSAATAMLMYTITASLPLLIIILTLMIKSDLNSFSNFYMAVEAINYNSFILNILVMMSFLVKFPIFLGHLWLPKAHVEAPASGSMILAAVLLKLGGYGVLRFSPLISSGLNSVSVLTIALWGGVISSVVCIQALDMKIIVAYSSVAHMALVIAALFVNSFSGVSGALIMMLAHGFSSSGLFFCVGVFSKYSNSRSMLINKGGLLNSPFMTATWFLVLAAGMGVPPTFNFWGELTCILAIISGGWINLLPCAFLVFFAGVYTLILYSVPTHASTSLISGHKNDYSLSEKLMTLTHFMWAILMILMMVLFD
uniref:NADH dehydrogenase subunit 4 n=1 Tax=Ergasilus tumidus TaxID=342420 RepID=UPI00243553E7|nr:NADH dehydrogenase subunit 4 [Ergasilus tumidus]WEU66999.1 NADH dehydrogenase subunit 4 [Ergasilus tumidus]